jgi:hypothetical protein
MLWECDGSRVQLMSTLSGWKINDEPFRPDSIRFNNSEFDRIICEETAINKSFVVDMHVRKECCKTQRKKRDNETKKNHSKHIKRANKTVKHKYWIVHNRDRLKS